MRSAPAGVGVVVGSCAPFCVAALGDDSGARRQHFMKLAWAEAEKIPEDRAKAYSLMFLIATIFPPRTRKA